MWDAAFVHTSGDKVVSDCLLSGNGGMLEFILMSPYILHLGTGTICGGGSVRISISPTLLSLPAHTMARPRITFSTPPLQAEVRKGPQGEAGLDSGLQQPIPAAGSATGSATGTSAPATDASEVSLVITRCKYYEMLTRCGRLWTKVWDLVQRVDVCNPSSAGLLRLIFVRIR